MCTSLEVQLRYLSYSLKAFLNLCTLVPSQIICGVVGLGLGVAFAYVWFGFWVLCVYGLGLLVWVFFGGFGCGVLGVFFLGGGVAWGFVCFLVFSLKRIEKCKTSWEIKRLGQAGQFVSLFVLTCYAEVNFTEWVLFNLKFQKFLSQRHRTNVSFKNISNMI